MRKFVYLLVIPALFACKEKDLTEEPPENFHKNLSVAASFVYDNQSFSEDSLLTNSFGDEFFITDIQMVFSDVIFVEEGDTVVYEEKAFILSSDKPEEFVLQMPKGGYSGYYGITLGLDSARGANTNPSTLPAESDLQGSNVFRNDQMGIDQVIIKGKLIDPMDPTDSIGKIPIEFRLGTHYTSRIETSAQRNFAIDNDAKIQFILQIDLAPALEKYNIYSRPVITTDLTNPSDLSSALTMADSLQIGLF